MAWERLSPGVYKNTATGEVRNSANRPTDGGGSSTPAAAPAPAAPALSRGLQDAQANLAQQVASGGIQQWQADAELNRLKGLEQSTQPEYSALPLGSPTDVINTTGDVAKGAQVAGNTLTNPNQVNPFGSQTVTYDPITGQPTVTQGLSGQNQQVAQGVQQGGIDANSVLSQMFQGGVLGSLGNSAGSELSNYEQAVFDRLTSGYDKNRTQDTEQLTQTLANRGIPVGSDLYNNQMSELNKRYDDMFTGARSTAVEQGTNQSMAALPTLSSIGQSAFMNPSFQGFTPVSYQQPDVGGLYNTQVNQGLSQQQIDIQKQQANRPAFGGGGGSNSSPFNPGPPPGYQG